jgi:hypothetical protein
MELVIKGGGMSWTSTLMNVTIANITCNSNIVHSSFIHSSLVIRKNSKRFFKWWAYGNFYEGFFELGPQSGRIRGMTSHYF